MRTLNEEDREWLEKLQESIWIHKKDRFGRTHSFPKDHKPLSVEDIGKVEKLIKDCELPCVLHSGPYGGLAISVHGHIVAIGAPPDFLLALDQKHFGLKSTFKTWHETFEEMSKFTHTPRNEELCKLYGLPTPRPERYYEY